MFLSNRGNPQVAQKTLNSKIDYELFLTNGLSPALTSFHRSRRCMVFHQNADVSESAGYLPARKREEKKHTSHEKFSYRLCNLKGKWTA